MWCDETIEIAKLLNITHELTETTQPVVESFGPVCLVFIANFVGQDAVVSPVVDVLYSILCVPQAHVE